MPTLLSSLKRLRREEPQDPRAEERPPEPGTPEEVKRLLLLIPTEGGFSFRLFPFADLEALRAYIARHEPQHGAIAFWALQENSPDGADNARREPLVLIRDATRTGLVHLYSFVDMESAHSFVCDEAKRGLDLRNVLVYWAKAVLIDTDAWGTDGNGAVPPVVEQASPSAVRGRAPKPVPAGRVIPLTAAEPVYQPDRPRVKLPKRPGGAIAPVPVAPVVQPEGVSAAPSPGNVRTESALGRLVAGIQAWPGWDGLAPLLIRALLLNDEAYQDFGRDKHATGRARLVVSIGILAAVIGAAGSGLTSAMIHLPAAALGWGAYAVAVYAVGTQAFKGRHDRDAFTRLFQTLGLASAPTFLLVLGIVPVYGPLFVLAAYIWLLLTTIAAVMPALELDNQSALVAGTAGCVVLFAVTQVTPLLLV